MNLVVAYKEICDLLFKWSAVGFKKYPEAKPELKGSKSFVRQIIVTKQLCSAKLRLDISDFERLHS